MPTVSATLQMFDQMTRPLQQVTQALNLTIRAMDNMNNSANRDIKITNSLNAAKGAIQRANAGLQELAISQERATNSQNKLNNSFEKGSSAAGGLTGSVKTLLKTYLGFQAVQKGAQITDNYTNQGARLALINDGLQTQDELQNKIYQSAQRAKAGYGDSVNAVAKLGLLAKDAFKSTDEVIAFTETMNKAFRISGASTSEATNGMYQLTQAMASGKLQGDEFRSILENAPMLAQAISDYTKVSMGELKKLSSEGAITSDVIKNALFKASDDINKKFETMPKTFGSIWTSIKNTAIMQFSQIMKKVNNFINTDTGAQVIQGITNAISVLAAVVGGLLDILMSVTTFFTNNWSTIGPIIWGVVLAMLAFNTAVAIGNTILGISNALKAIYNAYTAIQTGTTFAATAAQYGLNTALLACPLTWIIGLVVGLILALAALIAYCEPVREAFASAFEGIASVAASTFGYVVEFIEAALNHIINKVNLVIAMVNQATASAAGLWGGKGTDIKLFDNASLGEYKNFGKKYIQNMGTSKANAVRNFSADNIKAAINDFIGMGNKGGAGTSLNIPTVPDAANLKGKGLDKGLKGANDKLKNIDDKIDVSNEHLEMMRDLAEKESIQNFVTLSPSVSVTTGDIKNDVDINKIISKIESYMENELVSSAEGVYT